MKPNPRSGQASRKAAQALQPHVEHQSSFMLRYASAPVNLKLDISTSILET
jgi:hypothetical protein